MKKKLRLNHSTFETSSNGFATSFMMLLVCVGIPSVFIFAYPDVDILSDILASVGATLLLIALILSVCLAFLLSLIFYIKGRYEFAKCPSNIKSMIFDTEKISLIFNDKQLNCGCCYDDVRRVKLTLFTINVSGFSSSRYRSCINLGASIPTSAVVAGAPYNRKVMIEKIEICIVDNKGIDYKICVSKLQLLDPNMYRLLRDLVFFKQFIPFSYSFNGPVDYTAKNILNA